MAEITILVPVYNVERYLRRCLDSIINQTCSDLEILCLDDGSTDQSGKILDEYAKKDSRIQVIHKENTGYGSTMNLGIRMAHGTYIGIVESDDVIEKEMYQVMYQAAEKHKADMVKTDFYKLWDHEDGTEWLEYTCLSENKNLYHRVLQPVKEQEAFFLEKFTWNTLYNREFLQKNQIEYQETPGASYQDNGFWFQTMYCAKRIFVLNQAFYKYKQDNPSSSFHSKQKVYAMKEEYDFIHAFLKRKKEEDKRFYQICFHFRICGYLFTLERIADEVKLEFAKEMVKECEWYEKEKESCYQWLSEKDREIIRQLKQSPEGYIGEWLKERESIRESLDGFSHVIIYGAGSIGKALYWKLFSIREKERQVDFAVTALKGEKPYFYGHTIKELSDYVEEKENCLVVIAVSRKTEAFIEMVGYAERLGFKNRKIYDEIGERR